MKRRTLFVGSERDDGNGDDKDGGDNDDEDGGRASTR